MVCNFYHQAKSRISVATAAVFIVGAMCGSGILALPKALVDCGWAGTIFSISKVRHLFTNFISAIRGTVQKNQE